MSIQMSILFCLHFWNNDLILADEMTLLLYEVGGFLGSIHMHLFGQDFSIVVWSTNFQWHLESWNVGPSNDNFRVN